MITRKLVQIFQQWVLRLQNAVTKQVLMRQLFLLTLVLLLFVLSLKP